jgi:Peptidase dimerisation domain
MTDLTGHPELTPYRGGWCGNDIFPGALSPGNRERALDFTRRLGDRLGRRATAGQLEAELNVSPPVPYDVYEHPINLNIGMIRGGDWPSTVAAESVLHCRLALYPGAGVEELKRRVEDASGRRGGRTRRLRGAGCV